MRIVVIDKSVGMEKQCMTIDEALDIARSYLIAFETVHMCISSERNDYLEIIIE